jgi:hypothetical protein
LLTAKCISERAAGFVYFILFIQEEKCNRKVEGTYARKQIKHNLKPLRMRACLPNESSLASHLANVLECVVQILEVIYSLSGM